MKHVLGIVRHGSYVTNDIHTPDTSPYGHPKGETLLPRALNSLRYRGRQHRVREADIAVMNVLGIMM